MGFTTATIHLLNHAKDHEVHCTFCIHDFCMIITCHTVQDRVFTRLQHLHMYIKPNGQPNCAHLGGFPDICLYCTKVTNIFFWSIGPCTQHFHAISKFLIKIVKFHSSEKLWEIWQHLAQISLVTALVIVQWRPEQSRSRADRPSYEFSWVDLQPRHVPCFWHN